jgi:hypothetical protein
MFNILASVAFGTLWAGFTTALVYDANTLKDVWRWIRGLPLPAQVIAWLLCLPLMAGLWVWQASWPVLLRLALIGSLAVANLCVFLPWRV